jgi:predicted metal-dependent hydrolase
MTQQRFVFEPGGSVKEVHDPAGDVGGRSNPAPSTLRSSPGTVQSSPGALHEPAAAADHSSPSPDLPSLIDDRRSAPPDRPAADQQLTAVLRAALFVRNPRARRYVVRVSEAGVLRVTIPSRGSKRQAIEFVQQQRIWIANQLERAARERAQPREVMAPEMVNALRIKAKRELPARLLELAAEFGLTVSRITIRSQRFRWGSCSRAGRISLNWRLVTMPDWVRDYVLVHELMHLRRMDHSPTFWAHVARAYPNYQEARAWLRTFKNVPPPA